ncbi:hypothetical protein [Geodermatophilus sp. URMC 63]
MNDAFLLGGIDTGEVLETLRPHIFFWPDRPPSLGVPSGAERLHPLRRHKRHAVAGTCIRIPTSSAVAVTDPPHGL